MIKDARASVNNGVVRVEWRCDPPADCRVQLFRGPIQLPPERLVALAGREGTTSFVDFDLDPLEGYVVVIESPDDRCELPVSVA